MILGWVLQVLASISELFVSDSKSQIDIDQVLHSTHHALLLKLKKVRCVTDFLLQTVADIGKIVERTSMSAESRSKLLRALTQCAAPSDAVHQLL